MSFAFSFIEWRCWDCREVCSWVDAVKITADGKLAGFRHVDCEDPEWCDDALEKAVQ